ncbi:MAG TPA: efflux RND transporter permease subunit [Stellaceae bacterium]|jgi:multidrug efflux pump|nr:efflux RND transporter permease subunit [Stellaceae bacterium]
MSLSTPFIERPVATTLLTIGIALAGIFAFNRLPVAPLPQVDFPTISVTATMPGASAEVMAETVATPLERHLGVIADVTQMTSSSSLQSTRITLQFDLSRDIDGAARDVQAAINAARADLPANLRTNPTYRKVNPADAPIAILALTSDTLSQGQLYDAASTTLTPALSQIDGIGQVTIGGSSLPAVRVELNPLALNKYGIGLEDVRAALSSANAHSPKGAIEAGDSHYQIYTNDQVSQATDYLPLVVAFRNGAPVRLPDIADVSDSVENLRNQGLANGKPAVLVILYRQPNANIIETVDRVVGALPQLHASIPAGIDINMAMDRTTTIRSSLHDVETTLVISICLVVLVVFVFLRNPRATLIPSVAVPVSLVGTFGVMYLVGYSLDNLSLMALTISTGFVVDDAIVVLENVTRHLEAGMGRREAALQGAREVGFTVLSMSLSLIAVFAPILLMGGIVGRLFREFAMTLSIAIMISMAISLTTTPMMCAFVLRRERPHEHGRLYRASERIFDAALNFYDRTLTAALRAPKMVMLVLAVTVALNVFLFFEVPKGFFPQQDTGRMIGGLQADQSISFQLMRQKLQQFISIIKADPAVESVVGFTGGQQTNSGFVFVSLKPLAQRKLSVDGVIGRLRGKLGQVAGARLFLQAVQDITVGGRQSNAQYQYTLQGDSLQELYQWAPKVTAALEKIPELTEVNSDQQNHGLETDLVIDRSTAARLGLTVGQIDNTLYDAFGQRQVSVIYAARNQYHVVMEVAPQWWQNPDMLKQIYVSSTGGSASGSASTNAVAGTVSPPTTANNAALPTTNNAATVVASNIVNTQQSIVATPFVNSALAPASTATLSPTAASIASDAARNQAANSLASTGHSSTATSTGAPVSTFSETMVPLSAVTQYSTGATPLAVNHQGLFVATTISFNLKPGASLGEATREIDRAMEQLHVPTTIHGSFQGTAQVFQQSLANEPVLIAAALLAVYIVLGVLYESYVHPITILSTLPSAGVGAVLALMLCGIEFSIIALIGVILLIGIVKKNAIMMIDFALQAEREEGLSSYDAIYKASILRFRPIMMTTLAAMLGALPLAIGFGEGSELRRPLGISIVGGLLVSQALTLYTTPVIYLYLDRFRLWVTRNRQSGQQGPGGTHFAPGHAPQPGE